MLVAHSDAVSKQCRKALPTWAIPGIRVWLDLNRPCSTHDLVTSQLRWYSGDCNKLVLAVALCDRPCGNAYRAETQPSFTWTAVQCTFAYEYALNLSGSGLATRSNLLGETLAQVDQTLRFVTRCGHERLVGCTGLKTDPKCSNQMPSLRKVVLRFRLGLLATSQKEIPRHVVGMKTASSAVPHLEYS